MASQKLAIFLMLKQEVLKALIDVDSTTIELATYMGISTTTLYKFLNGKILNYQKYVKPLHEFFLDRGLHIDFRSHIWAQTGIIYLDNLTESQLSSLNIEVI